MLSDKSSLRTLALLRVLLIVNLAFLACYICFAYKLQFHADAAASNTLAQEISDTGRFFPPGWHYANADVWLIFLHAFELPLLIFMPNGFAAHAVASLLGAALILLAVWQLTGIMAMT